MTNGAPYPYQPPADDRQGAGGAGTRPPRRAFRVRRLVPLGVAAWFVLEIWLLTVVADVAGGLTVFALLLAGFVGGGLVMRRAGRRAGQRLAAMLHEATQPPSAGFSSRPGGNSLAVVGGLLLILPGLSSDVLGLLCLFPPTAALILRAGERKLASAGLGDALRQARQAEQQMRIHRPGGKVVQGEVITDDDASGER